MTVCVAALMAMMLSVLIPAGCSYNDTGFVFAYGSVFVLELAGSPRSEGFGNDLIWSGIRFWRPKMDSVVPSVAGSSYFIIPWILFVLIFGGMFRVLWRGPARRNSVFSTCEHCGYNLTGNVSGVCPECGTAIEAEQPSQS